MNDLIYECTDMDTARVLHVINRATAYEKMLDPKELGPGTFFAIKRARALVAVMGYQKCSGLALIRHAYVLPVYQRASLGSCLLGYIEALARRDGYAELLVGAYTDNRQVLKFYRRQGFSDTENSQELLARYWDIPERQAEASIVLSKRI